MLKPPFFKLSDSCDYIDVLLVFCVDRRRMATGGRRQSTEPSSAVVIDSPNHAASLLSQLSLMRMDRALTDTVLVAGETEVMCHRAVLAASSPYFQAMFHSTLRESREQRIKLDGVTALAVRRLVDYIYTGRIEVSINWKYMCMHCV